VNLTHLEAESLPFVSVPVNPISETDEGQEYFYRFISIHWFWEMLAKNEMAFISNDMWEDPWEGILVKKYMDSQGVREYKEHAAIRYFLCGTKEEHQKHHQWHDRPPSKYSVRLKISIRKLKESCAKYGIVFRKIDYGDSNKLNEILKNFNGKSDQVVNDLFFYKRNEFSDEVESRFLITTGHGEDGLFRVEIDSNIIVEVMFDPRISISEYELFTEMVLKKWPGIKVERSKLYDPPDGFVEYDKQGVNLNSP
jgi:hypothetical protein